MFLDISQPYRPTRNVMGIGLLFYFRRDINDDSRGGQLTVSTTEVNVALDEEIFR
jgi:hypothetical protein